MEEEVALLATEDGPKNEGDESENGIGTCPECGCEGPIGLLCPKCEDSGMIFVRNDSIAYAAKDDDKDSDESDELAEIKEFMYRVGEYRGLKGFNLISWLDAVVFKLAAIEITTVH